MSLVVDLGIFGCRRGGGLRKLPDSLMRCVGQVVVVKWVVRSRRVEFESMGEAPWCLVP
jgi:hypothetical protein